MKPIIVRGGGDLATGTIHRLCRSGYPVIILECERPSAIRRLVSFCQAVYEGTMEVEGMTCRLTESFDQALEQVSWNHPQLIVDPQGKCLEKYHPDILVDGILAKKNLGTRRDMADLTIALGPGFTAGEDVDYVIETKRGHYLGRIITEGAAIPNTGVPGVIGGYGKERVIHSPCPGNLSSGKRDRRLGGKGQPDRLGRNRRRTCLCLPGDFRRLKGNYPGGIPGNEAFQDRGCGSQKRFPGPLRPDIR